MATILYKEQIISKWLAGALGTITVIMLYNLVYQLVFGPIGTRPAPNSFFLVMFLLFLAATINFYKLQVIVTDNELIVSYGYFKRVISWEQIGRAYLDETSSLYYGGWGIRIGRVKGQLRLVYSVIGAPRIVVRLREGKYGEFVFSTADPEKVLAIIQKRLAN